MCIVQVVDPLRRVFPHNIISYHLVHVACLNGTQTAIN
jgi:hypothetical protein